MRLTRQAETIVGGNSVIANASIQEASTIVLIGKGFYVTNLVALDAERMSESEMNASL